MQRQQRRLFTVTLALILAMFSLGGALSVAAQTPAQLGAGVRVNFDTARGDKTCEELGAQTITEDGACTHGGDPAPPGYDITRSVDALPDMLTAQAIVCDGDGVSGKRVEVLYVRGSNTSSRYSQYLGSIRTWATDADTMYNNSATDTGGTRHLRFVTDANCQIKVTEVVINQATVNSTDFFGMINAVKSAGYSSSNRKYLMFTDANVFCGIGTYYNDDRDTTSNYNNGGYASYARVDAGCWSGHTAAHELGHNLGAVQNSAPHSTYNRPSGNPGGHCTDEYDIMCYSDYGNGQPAMSQVCTPSGTWEYRMDCNHDDYFHTNPPSGSYLATHWNVADNSFLISGSGGGGGGGGSTTMSVSAVTLTQQTISGGYQLTAKVTVESNGSAVSGAAVTASLKYPNNSTTNLTGSTDASGVATMTKNVTATGTYTVTVTNVTKSGLTYDPAANTTSSASVTIGGGGGGGTSMSVSAMTLSKVKLTTGYRITAKVTVKSGSTAVSGATVTLEFKYPNGSKYNVSAKTNSSGIASLSRTVTANGTYTVTVKNVTKSGYTYNAAGNAITSATIAIP